MGIGAIGVVFMLGHGASLSDVAMVKILQGVVIFLGEVPTGIVADMFGRKTSCLLACLCGIASFLAFALGGSLPWFYVAELFNALTIAFWSGAFEALTVDGTNEEESIDVVFSKITMYSSFATMIGGLVGGLIADYDIYMTYAFSTLVMSLAFACMLFSIREKKYPGINAITSDQNSLSSARLIRYLKESLKTSYREGFMNDRLKHFFYIQILMQFALQPMFHYWQPFISQAYSESSNSILGLVFLAYCCVQALYSGLSAKLIEKDIVSSESLIYLDISLLTLGFGLMAVFVNPILAVGGFLLVQGSNSGLQTLLSAKANKAISERNRATILSSVSFVSRLGMLICLAILSLIVDLIPVNMLFSVSLVATICTVPLVYVWLSKLRNNAIPAYD